MLRWGNEQLHRRGNTLGINGRFGGGVVPSWANAAGGVVMWPFKKKAPVKQWSDFEVVENCNECGHLGFSGAFGGCCPKCGIKNFTPVPARFEYFYRSNGMMMMRVNTGNYEVKQ